MSQIWNTSSSSTHVSAVCASGMFLDGDHVSSVRVSASMEKSKGWGSSTLHEGKTISRCRYDLGDSPHQKGSSEHKVSPTGHTDRAVDHRHPRSQENPTSQGRRQSLLCGPIHTRKESKEGKSWKFAGGIAGITNIHGCINLEDWPQ